MLVRKTEPFPIECVARCLARSGWKGIGGSDPSAGEAAGRPESDRLPEPIFTPATTASGRDVNIA
jgi:phosphoribosylaminoimidazole-succinocarboxamide synthase